jgi:anti-anti-sigma factor
VLGLRCGRTRLDEDGRDRVRGEGAARRSPVRPWGTSVRVDTPRVRVLLSGPRIWPISNGDNTGGLESCESLASVIGAVRLEGADGASIVALVGEQDLATLPELEKTLSRALASGLPLIVDLSGVTFVDGATVSLISRYRGEAETRRVPLILAIGEVTPRAVELVLEVAGCLAAPWVTKSREQAMVHIERQTT